MSVQAVATGCDIKLPTVPGTGDDAAANHTLSERPPGVRANSIQRMKAVVQMKQGHDAAACHEFMAGSECDVVH